MASSDFGREGGRDGDEQPFDISGGNLPPTDSADEALDLHDTPEQLDLAEEERLPWLDADDDEDVEEAGSGRIFGLVVLGLIALATIIGGIWWSTHRTSDEAVVADGSTLPPPAEPYKEAPKNPGGKTFEGTGNTAFAVSEGQERPAKLGEASPPPVPPTVPGAVPKPGVDLGKGAPTQGSATSGKVQPSPSAALAGGASSATAGGPAVQVGAYSTKASAEAAWGRLVQRYTALSGQRYRIVEGQADIGTVFRLQVVAGDASAAQSLCQRLKASGLPCQVK